MVYKIVSGTKRTAQLVYTKNFKSKLNAINKAKELRKTFDYKLKIIKK